jgi:hypothetical protein
LAVALLGVEGTYSLIGTHCGGPEDGDVGFSLTLQNISKISNAWLSTKHQTELPYEMKDLPRSLWTLVSISS